MSQMLTLGREILAKQPFSLLLHAELVRFEPGIAELQIPIQQELTQQFGFVHGGVLCYVADNALTFAGGSSMGVPVVTSEMKINYVRPAIGESLVARASTVYAGKSQAVCRCEVFVVKDGVEKLCAVAQGTTVKLSHGNT